MKTILFPFQKLLLLFFFVELLLDLDSTVFLVVSIGLLILSIILEGARPVTLVLIIIILIQFTGLSLFQILFIVIAGIVVWSLKFYDINVPLKGPYMVGHKYSKIKIDKRELLVAFYYPTDQKGTKVQWIAEKSYNKTLYQIFYVDPKMNRLPYQLFKFAVSYIQKIWVPAEGNSSYLNDEKNLYKNKVIVFSHGLGAHLNAYSSFFCNWASYGYTVVSINHVQDEVCVDYLKCGSEDKLVIRKYLHDCRYRDLQFRVAEAKKVIYEIVENNLLSENIKNENPIDQIILAGHSYGGGTVLATKSSLNKQLPPDHKIIKLINKIIALDPWLFPFKDETFETLRDQNILIINSNYFMQQVPLLYELQKLFVKLKGLNPKTKAFFIEKMDHISQCDMAYVFGNILQITGTIKNYKYTDYFMALNILMMRDFIAEQSTQEIMNHGSQFIAQHKIDQGGVKDNKIVNDGRQEIKA